MNWELFWSGLENLAQALQRAGPPFSLARPGDDLEQFKNLAWETLTPVCRPWEFREGRLEPAALDGAAILRDHPWDSDFFGFPCAGVIGPWLRPGPFSERLEAARDLGGLILQQARRRGVCFLSAKAPFEPGLVQGLLKAGFILAEPVISLSRNLSEPWPSPPLPDGYRLAEDCSNPAETARALGDFFYDGHYRFDAGISLDQAARLWTRAAEEQLSGRADCLVILHDERRRRPAGLAAAVGTAKPKGADLFILALAPAYRGRGLGWPLLAGLMDRLRRLPGPVETLHAQTAAYNRPALNLYWAAGFRPGAAQAALHAWL